jgi:hypothetical protein
VPYLPSAPLPVEEAFAALGDDLVAVKDQTGAPYLPDSDYQVDEIGRAEPGEGYKVYVARADTLRYPTPPTPSSSASTRTARTTNAPGPRNAPTSATLIVDAPELDDGTVVRARVEGEVLARTSVADGTAVLGIPGRSRFTPDTAPRADPGDRISLTAGSDDRALRVSAAESVIGPISGPPLRFRPRAVVHLATSQPDDVVLEKNYPNPARSTTTIAYTLPEATTVSLRVYSVLGQQVATLVDGRRPPGTHEVEFDASTLSSGVYFYRLEAENKRKSRKMTIVR